MVYVDKLFSTRAFRSNRWRHSQACHLFADTVEELHRFAQRIGLKRSWFQDNPRFPHYDLTAGKRSQAVRSGAKEVVLREYLMKKRDSG